MQLNSPVFQLNLNLNTTMYLPTSGKSSHTTHGMCHTAIPTQHHQRATNTLGRSSCVAAWHSLLLSSLQLKRIQIGHQTYKIHKNSICTKPQNHMQSPTLVVSKEQNGQVTHFILSLNLNSIWIDLKQQHSWWSIGVAVKIFYMYTKHTLYAKNHQIKRPNKHPPWSPSMILYDITT